jgi:membrane protease subunit HflC
MDNKKIWMPAAIAVGILVVIVALGKPFYIVSEREQVVVTRFNKPVHVIVGDLRDDFDVWKEEIIQSARRQEGNEGALDISGLTVGHGAGLKFKMPFIDAVESFPDTMIEYDTEPREVVTRDKKTLIVDNFARWRIENPLLFRIRVGSEATARGRLNEVIYSVLQEELGRSNLIEVIRTKKDFTDFGEDDEFLNDPLMSSTMLEVLTRGRDEIMNSVTVQSNTIARERFGIQVIDVRIKRADLLIGNLQAVFSRMQAERARISTGYESEGEKEASIIRGDTDKKVTILLAEAEAEAETIRGEGDAQALKIFADAFGQNPELYKFLRTLEVIGESTRPGSEFVIGIDSSIYRLLQMEN